MKEYFYPVLAITIIHVSKLQNIIHRTLFTVFMLIAPTMLHSAKHNCYRDILQYKIHSTYKIVFVYLYSCFSFP